jgi:hypothetical protein
MDPLTINTATFTLKQGSIVWSTTVTYSGVTAVLTPYYLNQSPWNLAPGTTYTATVTSGATDLAGNALVVPAVGGLPKPNPWTFTTAGPPVPPVPPPSCAGPGPLDLGTAATYGVLAGTSYTISINPTSITGDVGSPSITIPAGVFTLNGTKRDAGTDPNPGKIQTAVTDMQKAVTCANNRSCDVNYAAAQDFGGMTLGPGVYCVNGAITITGTLSLNAPGVYIFRASGVGTLDTAANAIVQLTPPATATNTSVFWVPVGATTLAANTTFLGTIMENSAAITVGANTTLLGGRALSGAAVTSTNNDTIAIPYP